MMSLDGGITCCRSEFIELFTGITYRKFNGNIVSLE